MTSLQNLRPQSATWPGFATKPIRVPENLAQRVLDMVKTWVNELIAANDPADVNVTVGADAPESEQEWANAIMGLPAGYKPGDPYPEALQTMIDAAREKKSAASAPETSQNPIAVAVDKDWNNEPERCTQAWIDFMQSEPNPHGWNWPDYLAALRQEAREGHDSAKTELEAFRSNGVAISGGSSSTVQAAPSQTSPRQTANKQRREERRERRQAKYLVKKNPYPHAVTSSGAVIYTTNSTNGRGEEVFNLPRVKPTAPPFEIEAAKRKRYQRVMAVFNSYAGKTLLALDAFFARLRSEGKTGKIRRFQPPLDALKKWVITDAPTIADFYSPEYMDQYKVFHKNCKQDFINHFYSTPEQTQCYQVDGKDHHPNLDGEFYVTCLDLFDALYLGMVTVDMEDDDNTSETVALSE